MAWTLRKIDEELRIAAQCEGDYPGGYPPTQILPNLCKIMYAAENYHMLPEMGARTVKDEKEMSETYDRIQETIKNAMKSGNASTRDTLRMVVSDIKNKTVNEGKEITEDVVIGCVKRAVKQLEDTIASAKAANRPNLEEKAKDELADLSLFLPPTIPDDMLEGIIKEIIATKEKELGRSLTKKDFGLMMKSLPSNCDKKLCSNLLKGMLA
jgi:uncharacterized protein YqeY